MRPGRQERDAIGAGIDPLHVVATYGPGDEAVSRIATAQDGAIATHQLLACGLTSTAIHTRVRRGWLRPRHRGVYLVGHEAVTDRTEVIAAALATGPGSAAWAHTATWLHGFTPTLVKPLHMATPGRHRRSRPGIRMHRIVGLRRSDLMVLERIPVVAPAMALRGLAARSDPEATRRALNEARTKRIDIDRRLTTLMARQPGAAGWGALSMLLKSDRGPDFTREEAEARLWRLILTAGLPRPLRNQRVYGFEVDFFWPHEGVIVEVDGYAFHSSPAAFERDRERWAELARRGTSVTPFTWKQIVHRRQWIVAHIASRLATRGAGGSAVANDAQ